MAEEEENLHNLHNLRSRRSFSNFNNVDDLTEVINNEVIRDISEKKKKKQRNSVDSITTNFGTKPCSSSTTSIHRGNSDPIFTSIPPHSPKSVPTPALSAPRKRKRSSESQVRKRQIMSSGDIYKLNTSPIDDGTPLDNANGLESGGGPPAAARSDLGDDTPEDAMETDEHTSRGSQSGNQGIHDDFLEVSDQGNEAREARERNADTLDAIFSHIEMHMDEEEQAEYRNKETREVQKPGSIGKLCSQGNCDRLGTVDFTQFNKWSRANKRK